MNHGLHFDFLLHLCDTAKAPKAELENFADKRRLQKGAGFLETAEIFRKCIYRVNIDELEDQKQTFGFERGYFINKHKATPERAKTMIIGEYPKREGRSSEQRCRAPTHALSRR